MGPKLFKTANGPGISWNLIRRQETVAKDNADKQNQSLCAHSKQPSSIFLLARSILRQPGYTLIISGDKQSGRLTTGEYGPVSPILLEAKALRMTREQRKQTKAVLVVIEQTLQIFAMLQYFRLIKTMSHLLLKPRKYSDTTPQKHNCHSYSQHLQTTKSLTQILVLPHKTAPHAVQSQQPQSKSAKGESKDEDCQSKSTSTVWDIDFSQLEDLSEDDSFFHTLPNF